MESLIKVAKIKKAFDQNIILNNIDFDVVKGEIFGIIGGSGSGKTTLLNTLVGFLIPDSGSVSYNFKGKYMPVQKYPEKIKKRFGFAAQHPSFYSKLTIFENLDYFGSLFELSTEARLMNINTLLDLVELDPARDILAKNLSGGMQRRLDIACSLIHNPEILILDEPTSDLDTILAKNIWELIKKINKKGTTIVVASHDLSEVETVCTRIGILSKRKLEKIGTIDELKNVISKGQEIHLETYPGNYKNIIKNFNDKLIIDFENRGNYLVIHTQKPAKVLTNLLKELPKLDENLLDVKITKLSLRDVFTNLAKNEN